MHDDPPGGAHHRIALVIPCRNAAPWIVETLNSIAAQTRPADEVIVVDDGSVDNSLEIANAWVVDHAGSSLRVVSQPASGVAAALRRGIAETTSPLLCRVDADDLLEPTFLEALEAALYRRPDAGYAYPAVRMFGAAEGRYPVRDFDAVELVIGGNFVTAAALMRREAYDASGGVADLPAWEDWDLWLRFLEAGWPGVFVDEELYLWRRHAASRNVLTWAQRRRLRAVIWWRHRRLVSRYLGRGVPVALKRMARPVRQQ